MLLTERDRQLGYPRQLSAESAGGSGRVAAAVGSRAERGVAFGLLRQHGDNHSRAGPGRAGCRGNGLG